MVLRINLDVGRVAWIRIRIQLFNQMRIRIRLFTLLRIRILLHIKVMQICDHLARDHLARAHLVAPRAHLATPDAI
jgi:hypothetical protein